MRNIALVFAVLAASMSAKAADPLTDLARAGVQVVCSQAPDFQLITELCHDLVTAPNKDEEVSALVGDYQQLLGQLDALEAAVQNLPGSSADPAARIQALDALEADTITITDALYPMVEKLSEEIERRRFLLAHVELLGHYGDHFPPTVQPAISLLVGNTDTLQLWIAHQEQMVDTLVALQELRATIAESRTAIRAPEGSFNGVWGSTYGNEMVLRVNGDQVNGTYGEDNGRVSFTIAGPRTLEGYWVEDGSIRTCDSEIDGSPHWGRLVLVFDESFNTYGGSWSYCDDEVSGSLEEWVGDFLRPLGE